MLILFFTIFGWSNSNFEPCQVSQAADFQKQLGRGVVKDLSSFNKKLVASGIYSSLSFVPAQKPTKDSQNISKKADSVSDKTKTVYLDKFSFLSLKHEIKCVDQFENRHSFSQTLPLIIEVSENKTILDGFWNMHLFKNKDQVKFWPQPASIKALLLKDFQFQNKNLGPIQFKQIDAKTYQLHLRFEKFDQGTWYRDYILIYQQQ